MDEADHQEIVDNDDADYAADEKQQPSEKA